MPALLGGPDADRQRFDQRGRLVGHRVRHRVRPVRLAGRRTARRRRGSAGWRRTRRRGTGCSGRTGTARHRPQVSCGSSATRCPTRSDRSPPGPTARIVPEASCPSTSGSRDDEVGDPAVVEVVHVRAADADRGDLDQHLAGTRFGHRRPVGRPPLRHGSATTGSARSAVRGSTWTPD